MLDSKVGTIFGRRVTSVSGKPIRSQDFEEVCHNESFQDHKGLHEASLDLCGLRGTSFARTKSHSF